MALALPIFITPTDPNEILAAIKADYESRTGRVLQPAQVEMLLINAMAYRESLLRLAIQDAGEQNLVDFARAPMLDYIGQIVGTNRLPAQSASVEIEFTLVSGHPGVTIPALTRVASTDNRAVFRVTQDVDVIAGVTTALADCECDSVGSIGNGYIVGTVSVVMDPQAFIVSATNTSTTGGGTDQEDDAALRERIKIASEAFSSAGPRGAYEFHARTVSPAIIDVAVVTPPISPPGEVHLYPLMEDGQTTPQTIIDAVLAKLTGEKLRPVCDTVLVFAPTDVAYTLDVELTLYDTADQQSVLDAVNDALAAFVLAKRQKLGRDIISTQIVSVVHGAAMDDIYETVLPGFTDIVIAPTEYGVCTAINVSVTGTTNG